MKLNIIPVAQLSNDHLSAWSRLQRSDPTLVSPFFRPEFTQAVAAERPDVEVAVWEKAGEPVVFLPFQRSNGRVGQPVGSLLNQSQGAIARGDVAWSPQEAVQAAGLRAWRFDHLVAAQHTFAPYQYVAAPSPYLDLSQGFEHYRRSRGKSAAKFIAHVLQKDRKAGRDVGEVRLELDSGNRDALRQLIEWKTSQCHSTGVPCAFDLDWVVRLVGRFLDRGSDEFNGSLFSLRMGNRLAAACLSIRSGSAMQGVILGYDRELSSYAPGLVLVMRMAQMAIALGVTRIDMGKGGEAFKDKIASGYDQVTEGAVHANRVWDPVYRGWLCVKDRLRSTRLRGPVRRVRARLLTTRARFGYRD